MVTLAKKRVTNKAGKTYEYWVLRWRIGRRRPSKPIGRTDRVSRRQAEKIKARWMLELMDKPGKREPGKTLSLGVFLSRYLDARRRTLAPGTLALHAKTGDYLTAWIGGDVRIDHITRGMARDFASWLGSRGETSTQSGQKLKPATIDMHLRNARTMFQMAVDDEILDRNPFAKMASSKTYARDWYPVGSEEFWRLYEHARPAWRLMLALCRLAGLRRGEALALRWSNIDWQHNRMRIIASDEWRPKDRDHRDLPIVRELQPILLDAYANVPQGNIYVIEPGAIVVQNISRDFTILCRRAGVKRYRDPTHALRKSCLHDWALFHPAHVVQEWAGHADAETTRIHYLKVSELEFDKAAGMTLLASIPERMDPTLDPTLQSEVDA